MSLQNLMRVIAFQLLATLTLLVLSLPAELMAVEAAPLATDEEVQL